ncbi:MAG: hypothetical protein ACXW29_07295, partial [Thermoanaerobaculia bacterium]
MWYFNLATACEWLWKKVKKKLSESVKSPLYQREWHTAEMVGAIGGTLMFVAIVLYFLVFFGTMLRKKTAEGTLELPVSEPYHDEDIRAVQSLRPWLLAA